MGLILRAVKRAYLFKRGAKAGHRAQILPGKHAYKMPYAVLFHRKAAARHQILRFGVAQRGQHISRAQHRRFRLYSRLHARPFFKISRICTAFFPSLRFIYKQAVLRKHGIYVFFTGALPAVCSLPEVCARPCLGLVAVVFEGRLKRPRHFLCHKLPFCFLICRYFSPRALNSGFFTLFSRGSRFFAKSGGKQKRPLRLWRQESSVSGKKPEISVPAAKRSRTASCCNKICFGKYGFGYFLSAPFFIHYSTCRDKMQALFGTAVRAVLRAL